jgi:hypothetical protein
MRPLTCASPDSCEPTVAAGSSPSTTSATAARGLASCSSSVRRRTRRSCRSRRLASSLLHRGHRLLQAHGALLGLAHGLIQRLHALARLAEFGLDLHAQLELGLQLLALLGDGLRRVGQGLQQLVAARRERLQLLGGAGDLGLQRAPGGAPGLDGHLQPLALVAQGGLGGARLGDAVAQRIALGPQGLALRGELLGLASASCRRSRAASISSSASAPASVSSCSSSSRAARRSRRCSRRERPAPTSASSAARSRLRRLTLSRASSRACSRSGGARPAPRPAPPARR